MFSVPCLLLGTLGMKTVFWGCQPQRCNSSTCFTHRLEAFGKLSHDHRLWVRPCAGCCFVGLVYYEKCINMSSLSSFRCINSSKKESGCDTQWMNTACCVPHGCLSFPSHRPLSCHVLTVTLSFCSLNGWQVGANCHFHESGKF